MRRNTYVCVPCRKANRTGGACTVCNQPTVRCYWPVPQAHNLKAWKKLAEKLEKVRWQSGWWRASVEDKPEKPQPFDFSRHLREKKARWQEPKAEQSKKPKACPYKKRRCHPNRLCENCKANKTLEVLAQ